MTTNSPQGPSPGLDASKLKAHGAWMQRLARALVKDEASADDLLQEAWLAASRSEVPVRNVRGYLAGTLRHLAQGRARAEGRRHRREERVARREAGAGGAAPGADEVAERVEILRIVLEELQTLRPTWRRAISLHFVEGLDVGQIAQAGGTSCRRLQPHVCQPRRPGRPGRPGRSDRWNLCVLASL